VEFVMINQRVSYRTAGDGPAVLLLHGWPTSSYLWRNIMPVIAERNRVIAIDLPGFGESDKPLDVRYDFEFFEGIIDGLLGHLNIDRVALAGHDLGGPIAVHWALRNPDRTTGIALLNTLLYPQLDPSVVDFVTALATPGPREEMTSPDGLSRIFRAGLADPTRATGDILTALVHPFRESTARRALAQAGIQLSLRGLAEIERGLPGLRMPVRIVYGAQDRVLPDVAGTMDRVARDVPHAVVTVLPDCGHFLQEDAPDEVARQLAEFFADTRVTT
jgi:haloalkane dehalogenase